LSFSPPVGEDHVPGHASLPLNVAEFQHHAQLLIHV
jgi:hypothetical protein